MKTRIFAGTILIIISTILILITGCESESNTSVRQERLYSAENIELKKQITRLEQQIAQLKDEHKKDIADKEKMLQKCYDEQESASKLLDNDVVKMFENEVIMSLTEQVQQLTDENKELKTKIEQLENTQTE